MSVRGRFLGVWVLISFHRWRITNTQLAPLITFTFSSTINSSVLQTILQTFHINIFQWRAAYFLPPVPFPKQRIKVEQTAPTFTVMKIFSWGFLLDCVLYLKIVKIFIVNASFTFVNDVCFNFQTMSPCTSWYLYFDNEIRGLEDKDIRIY